MATKSTGKPDRPAPPTPRPHVLSTVVAKAAAQLGVTHDVRLLDRCRRGVEPTVYGTTLLKAGRTAFEELRQGINIRSHRRR